MCKCSLTNNIIPNIHTWYTWNTIQNNISFARCTISKFAYESKHFFAFGKHTLLKASMEYYYEILLGDNIPNPRR